MVKHATSHGFAVLMCTIISAFLINTLSQLLPQVIRKVDELSILLINQFNVPLSIEYLSISIVASLLAMLWGIFFKIYNSEG